MTTVPGGLSVLFLWACTWWCKEWPQRCTGCWVGASVGACGMPCVFHVLPSWQGKRVCAPCPMSVQFREAPSSALVPRTECQWAIDTLWDSKQGKIKLWNQLAVHYSRNWSRASKPVKRAGRSCFEHSKSVFSGRKGRYCAGETSAVPLIALQISSKRNVPS